MIVTLHIRGKALIMNSYGASKAQKTRGPCTLLIYNNGVEVFLRDSHKAIADNRRSVSAQGVASRELLATKDPSYDASKTTLV